MSKADAYEFKVESLPSGEWRSLFRPSKGTRPPRGWTCQPCDRHFVLRDGQRIASFIGFLYRQIRIDEVDTNVAGLGYGATSQQYEREGCLRRLVQEAKEYFRRAQEATVIVITCLDTLVPFYTRDGWHRVEGEVKIGQPGGIVTMPKEVNAFVFPLEPGWVPVSTLDFRGLPW